jgi:hypothetical protein
VGGKFDYINYGTSRASIASGLRVATKNFAKINLLQIKQNISPNFAITRDDIATFNSTFTTSTEIYDITSFEGAIYVGGLFECKNNTDLNLTSKNIGRFLPSGVQDLTWKPIIIGAVRSITIDDTSANGGDKTVYVGGDFTHVFDDNKFYSGPRAVAGTEFKGACAYHILSNGTVINEQWRPSFNGSVSKIVSQDDSPNSNAYVYGPFTTVNGSSVSHVCVIGKASSSINTQGTNKDWHIRLNAPPSASTRAIVIHDNTVVVGGNFTQVNGVHRVGMCRINKQAYATGVAAISSVTWDFDARVIDPGSSIAFDSVTDSVRLSAASFPIGHLNATTFVVNNVKAGQLVRIQLRRPGNMLSVGSLPSTNDTLQVPAHIVGIKINQS